MKTLFKFLFFSGVITLSSILGGCSSNDTDDIEVKTNKEEAYFLLSFTSGAKFNNTKAADPTNALASEVTVNTVDVYVYDGATFERHVQLLGSDFQETTAGSNIWALNSAKKIGVVAGNKSVYVGVNLPAAYNQFRVSDNAFYMNSLNDLNSAANGFAMFSTEVVSKTIAYNATEMLTIPVSRLLAKVAVHSPQTSFTLAGAGTFSDLKYDVYNNNKGFFLFQEKSGGYVVDPNYDWSATDYSSDFLTGAGYLNVQAAPANYTSYLNVRYTLENTTKYNITAPGAKLQKTSTYATLAATFTPTTVIDAATKTATTSVKGTTFYQVEFEGGEIVYVYAANLAAADAYAASVANGRTYSVVTYTNGVCYYNIFLAKNNGYDLLRNTFYIVNVDNILSLGSPTPGINPTAPIESEAYLQVTVDIQPWSLDIQNVSLSN